MNSSNMQIKVKEKLNMNKRNNILNNIKSNYIMKQIFKLINQKRMLEIMKYSKKIMNRLDKSLNTYKEYCETFTTIEILLLPDKKNYGNFVNIQKEDKSFFHIYFDNSVKEVKKCDLDKNDSVKQIKIIIEHQVKSFINLFANCSCLNSISFIKLYRNNINNMNKMFFRCSTLKEIKFVNFKTNNVINMGGMFKGCS